MTTNSDRPVLSLEEEITNNLSHMVDYPLEMTQTLKSMPSLLKRIMKELSTINSARGQLMILMKYKDVIPNSEEEITKLETYISETEAKLKKQYYREEIKGT